MTKPIPIISNNFKLGDKSDQIWCGDLCCECEFVSKLDHGKMLWHDTDFLYFRLVFWDNVDGKLIMNKWESSRKISDLLD